MHQLRMITEMRHFQICLKLQHCRRLHVKAHVIIRSARLQINHKTVTLVSYTHLFILHNVRSRIYVIWLDIRFNTQGNRNYTNWKTNTYFIFPPKTFTCTLKASIFAFYSRCFEQFVSDVILESLRDKNN